MNKIIFFLLLAFSQTAQAEIVFEENFEAFGTEWVIDNNIWEVGEATTGPETCYSGTSCAGTVLADKYPYGPDSRLISPEINLPEINADEEIILRFREYWTYSYSDRGEVQIQSYDVINNTWSDWTTLKIINQHSPIWHHGRVNLSNYAGQQVRLAFYHIDGTETNAYGNAHTESTGWYIDDVEIVTQIVPVISEVTDFESGWGAWYSDNGIWEVGEATAGPGSCYNGTSCAGTVLAGNYPYGPDSRLISPEINLPEINTDEEILLRFQEYWTYSSSDRGEVQIQSYDVINNTWSDWTTLKIINQHSPIWHHGRVNLSSYGGQQVRLAFYHIDGTETNAYGNAHTENTGWYIDDVEIITQIVPVFSRATDFESGWGAWYSDNGIWEVGEATAGPGSCYSGNNCAGTVLAGNYSYGPDSRLISPEINLPEINTDEEILLRFREYWTYSSSDRGEVQIQSYDVINNTWSDWTTLKIINQHSPIWHHGRVNLSSYAGQQVRIAFYHIDGTETNAYGNAHTESTGWYIDDVEVLMQTVPVISGATDFESGWGAWYSDNGIWEVGEATAGPGSCYSGTNCAGTVLAGNYPYGPDSRLISPEIDLPVISEDEEILLRFREYWTYSSSDRGEVQIQSFDVINNTWSDWTTLKIINQHSPIWHHGRVNLSSYAGQQVRIAFYHIDGTETNAYGNAHTESTGWYIDDVEVLMQTVPVISGATDFESGWGAWYSDNGIWEVGEATAGPGSCYSGTSCAGTVLAGNYPYGPDSRLISPEIDLPDIATNEQILLRFRQYWTYSSSDKGVIQISTFDPDTNNWMDWEDNITITSNTTDWQHSSINLSEYAGMRIRISFFHTDGTETNAYGNAHTESAGWYIDDIEFPEPTQINHPWIQPIENQMVAEGTNLSVNVFATDPNGEPLTLTIENLPTFSTFTDNGDGTGVLDFNPVLDTSGSYVLSIIADNGTQSTTRSFSLQVNNFNQAPQISPIADHSMQEANTLNISVIATDPDYDTISLSADIPAFATFTDYGNGEGMIQLSPLPGSADSYPIHQCSH